MKKLKLITVLGLLVALIATSISLVGCGNQTPTTENEESIVSETEITDETEVAEEPEEESVEATETESSIKPKEGGYVVAFSNGFITHSWRTQMVNDFQKSIEFYKGMGLVKDYMIQHAGFDVNIQISKIQNIISLKPVLLIVNPLSNAGLNSVLEQAVDAGIMVIVEDDPVTSPEVYQVIHTHDKWQYKLSKYVFDRMNGEGKIIYVSGINGAPASDMRDVGFEEALAEYPDIELLTKVFGSWDAALGQQAVSDILAAYPEIDGVVAQESASLATIRAFEAAGRDITQINGEGFQPFLAYWVENLENGFTSYAIESGPGFALTTALGIGLRMLMGSTFKEEYLPAGEMRFDFDHRFEITDDNVAEVLEEHIRYRGVEDYIDNIWPMKDINALFNESAELDVLLP